MDFNTSTLAKLIVHYVGSKNNLDPIYLSDTALALDEDLLKIIGDSFLHKFKNAPERYSFHHPSSLQFNEVYQYCSAIWREEDSFENISINIAKHLYESSTHPKVKGGELYVAFFESVPVEGRMHKAIGLFKTENKVLFLDVQHQQNNFQLAMKEGVELTKVDKGCLILNTKEDEGFDVLLFDNQNRGEEAQYWKEKFLGVIPQKDEYHQTAHFLNLTKQYITEQLESEFKVPKTEQIDLLNKSIDYFKSKESFDVEEFQAEVFQNTEMIESFRHFGSRYVEHHDIDLASQFDISTPAVKKQARIYKSVVKLDKNFHIYIHGRTDLIEKGMDMDGRKYYKIYYEEEA